MILKSNGKFEVDHFSNVNIIDLVLQNGWSKGIGNRNLGPVWFIIECLIIDCYMTY